MSWVEKHRPKSMEEVVGNNKVKEELKKWIEDYIEGKTTKPVLLVGPPGCGKTTLATALGRDYNFEVIELNASDKRNSDIIKQVVGNASISKSLSGRRTLIILDEVDGISGNYDKGGLREILRIIRIAKNPLILTANDIYKPSLRPLRQACKVIKIGAVHTNSIVPLLRRILLKEGLEVDDKILKTIAKHAGGDVRAAINDLESLALGGDLNREGAKDLHDRDVEKNIFDAIRIILKTTHYDIALSTTYDLKEDIQTIEEWIAENIPREYKKNEDIALAYDYLSKADVFLGRVHKRQNYGLWKYASALMTAGVALAKREKYRGFSSYSRPTVFTKLSKEQGSKALLKKILSKIKSKSHVSTKRAREDLIYLRIICKYNQSVAAEIAEFYEFTIEELEYLTDKKIAKKIYNIIEENIKCKKTEDRENEKRNMESPLSNGFSIDTVENIGSENLEDIKNINRDSKENGDTVVESNMDKSENILCKKNNKLSNKNYKKNNGKTKDKKSNLKQATLETFL